MDSDVSDTDGIAISIGSFDPPRGSKFLIQGKIVLGVTYVIQGCRVKIEVSLPRI